MQYIVACAVAAVMIAMLFCINHYLFRRFRTEIGKLKTNAGELYTMRIADIETLMARVPSESIRDAVVALHAAQDAHEKHFAETRFSQAMPAYAQLCTDQLTDTDAEYVLLKKLQQIDTLRAQTVTYCNHLILLYNKKIRSIPYCLLARIEKLLPIELI